MGLDRFARSHSTIPVYLLELIGITSRRPPE